MNSPKLEFPGEDFFHPGFTPASFTPKPEPPPQETPEQQPLKSRNAIPRRPVPQQQQPATAASPAATKTSPLGLGLGTRIDSWTGSDTLVGTSPDRAAEAEPPVAGNVDKVGEPSAATPAARLAGEVSSPSSAYGGESTLPSASPSHPSPPPPWPASPHVQQDFAFSQLHGGGPLSSSQPVSPISESELFDSRNASRANSLAYRVSKKGSRSGDSRKDAPLPPLPYETQPVSGPSAPGVSGAGAGAGIAIIPEASSAEVGPSSQGPAVAAVRGQALSERPQADSQLTPKEHWPLEQHAVVASPPQRETGGQPQTLQLPFQREDESPIHETPLSQRPASPELFSSQVPLPGAQPSPPLGSSQQPQQRFIPQRNSQQQQQPFSPYVASPQQQQRFSQQRYSHRAFSPARASVQGMPPSNRRTSSQVALHPLQQHPPAAHPRMSSSGVAGSGETPFVPYEDVSVFEPTTDTSGFKEEEMELGRGGLVGVEGVSAARRLSAESRSGAASAHTLWGGYRASWLPEILWCMLAVACLGIIGVLLSRYDGQSVVRWPLPITLNTLIAFLVSICHAALLFPVLEGLGQLKWNWFAKRDRSLADFQAYEDARRGPFGVARLVYVTKGRDLSLLAAIIMLTSIVTSPLTQMMIEYPTRLTSGSNRASVFRSESYPYSNRAAVPNPTDLDVRQKQSIQQGIYNPVDVAMAPLPPSCGSEECRFQSFSSLSICARAEDVTSLLMVSDRQKVGRLPVNLNLPSTALVRNASLSNGVYLLGSANTYNFNMSTPASAREGGNPRPGAGSLSFSKRPELMETAISNFFVIYTNITQQPPPSPPPAGDSDDGDGDDGDQDPEIPVSFRAVEVLIHFCVGTYEVAVDQSGGGSGLARTVRTATSTTMVSSQQQQPLVLTAQEGGGAATRNFTIDRASSRVLANYMASTFSGAYSGAGMGSGLVVGYTGTADAFGSAMFGSGPARAVDGSSPSADDPMRQTLWNITQNVATSLTNTIRSLGVTEPGLALETETFVSVRWGWLAVLAAQVLLAAAFLGGVAAQTAMAGVRVLKASGGLATMMAVSADDRRVLEREGIGRLDEGRIMAGRLEEDGIRGRFGAGQGDRGWGMDLGVRIEEIRSAG